MTSSQSRNLQHTLPRPSNAGRSRARSRSAGAPRPRPSPSWPKSAMAAIPAAANAFPTPATARRRKPPWPPCRRCRNRCPRGLDRAALQAAMPAGAARNALDCALVDLEAKSAGQRAWTLLGRPAPQACTTAYTISLGTPEAMADSHRQGRAPPAAQDQARRRRRRRADRCGRARPRPNSELIVDANEAWTPDNLAQNLAACADAGVTLVEQPLAGRKG